MAGLCDSVTVDDKQLDVVVSFCYLGDSISAGGGCEAASVAKVRELLPVLGSKSLSLHTCGMRTSWGRGNALCEVCEVGAVG